MTKGFVDILFILLCSTIVMLSQSLQVSSLDIAPAKVGGNGVSSVNADDVRLVVVYEDSLGIIEREVNSTIKVSGLPDVIGALGLDKCILLMAGNEDVSHQRVMDVWSQCQESDLAVKLGAQPKQEYGTPKE